MVCLNRSQVALTLCYPLKPQTCEWFMFVDNPPTPVPSDAGPGSGRVYYEGDPSILPFDGKETQTCR